MRLFSVILATGLAGCVVLTVPVSPPAPILWRIVEADVDEGRILVLEPDPPQLRIELRLSRERAETGEIVEAEIWLPDAEGHHRIELRPNRPDVSLLGPREIDLEGAERARIRFTCSSVGRGGLLVIVKE